MFNGNGNPFLISIGTLYKNISFEFINNNLNKKKQFKHITIVLGVQIFFYRMTNIGIISINTNVINAVVNSRNSRQKLFQFGFCFLNRLEIASRIYLLSLLNNQKLYEAKSGEYGNCGKEPIELLHYRNKGTKSCSTYIF